MKIWNIYIDEMELDELVKLQRDGRVKFAFDTAFVLEQDKAAIEEKFDLKCILGEDYFCECVYLDYQNLPFEFDLLNMFRDALDGIDEEAELFYINFPKWLDLLLGILMDELSWCNNNSELCKEGFLDMVEGLIDWDQLINALKKGWITPERFKEITGKEPPEMPLTA